MQIGRIEQMEQEENAVVLETDEINILSEKKLEDAEKYIRFSISYNIETDTTTICPINKDCIIIHGAEEAKYFTDQIMGPYRE